MAMYFALRRASSSLLPLAFRAVASSPRTFHATPSALKDDFVELVASDPSIFARFVDRFRFPHRKPLVVEVPNDFPFKVEVREVGKTSFLLLHREYDGAIITVELHFPVLSAISESEKEIRLEVNMRSEKEHLFYGKHTFNIKAEGYASRDEICIETFSPVLTGESIDKFDFESRRQFKDLSDDFQKFFHEALEKTGINLSTINFLREYVDKHDAEFVKETTKAVISQLAEFKKSWGETH